MAESIHTSVLLQEVLDLLSPQPGDVVVDGTVGGGGHAAAIVGRLGKDVRLYCFDADGTAISAAKEKLERVGFESAQFFKENFRSAAATLAAAGVPCANRVLLDLGTRSDQLEQGGRGFSFQVDEPLYMTLADEPASDALTAERIVNTWSEEDIANVIYAYGEERASRRIAAAIVAARAKAPIKTSAELAAIVAGAVPKRGRIHPATKTFQALRIAVNDEYGALTEGLTGLWNMLAVGGRLAAISFHSGEDRIVKRFMKERAVSKEGVLVTKKPVTPSDEEVAANPRSRSAKLRVIERRVQP